MVRKVTGSTGASMGEWKPGGRGYNPGEDTFRGGTNGGRSHVESLQSEPFNYSLADLKKDQANALLQTELMQKAETIGLAALTDIKTLIQNIAGGTKLNRQDPPVLRRAGETIESIKQADVIRKRVDATTIIGWVDAFHTAAGKYAVKSAAPHYG